jgi:hypothetical protein
MNMRTLMVTRSRSSWVAATAIVLIAAMGIGHARAGVVTQLVPFFYPDGSEVVTATGEPDDAVLNRFADTRKERINWQFMTQYLNPGEMYDVWLEGSNDGTDRFSWWIGRVKANARGNLNGFGNAYVGEKLGPGSGEFTSARATANLVIKTTDGVTMQTAYFPPI